MSRAVAALVGTPNTGKSSLFNMLTGSKQKVGNYPGVTVEKRVGALVTDSGLEIEIIDLPGTYSLSPISPDEDVAIAVLNGESGFGVEPDVIIAVADAANLERTLGLVVELIQLGKPLIIALNMMDLAISRGIAIDLKLLSKSLGIPVVSTVAVERHGVDELIKTCEEQIKKTAGKTAAKLAPLSPKERFKRIDEVLKEASYEAPKPHILTHRLDSVLLHAFFGPVFLVAMMILMFQAVFSWAEAPMGWIEMGVASLGEGASYYLPSGWLQDLLVDGIIAGVGSVIVFLPQIVILFFFIFLLEGSGYMMRAAFLLDRLMSRVGLQGRSFVPLLSSFACAIPGIMATRTIRDPRDRLITLLVAPLMTCSARLPVYILLIGAFIPAELMVGPFQLQGLIMFALFVAGILSAMSVAFIIRRFSFGSQRSACLMELPTYKIPSLRQVFFAVWIRAKAFLRRAGTIIMTVSVVLWVLSSYPKPPADYSGTPIEYSMAGRIGQVFEPIIAPLGFDWRIATGLIPGFAAREVMVGALATVFAVEDADDDEGAGFATLQEKIKNTWPLATGLSLLVWYIFAPQCLATFAVVRRETNSWRWTAIGFGYMLGLAYIFALLTYHLASLI